MAAVRLQMVPSVYASHSKNNLFVSANTYENCIVSREYCIVRYDGKMCFLPTGSFHIILTGDIKELLQNLDEFCFNYQHVVVWIHISSTDSVAKLMSRVDNSLIMCRGQFISTTNTDERTECPGLRKRDS